jgi:hypothetical protein
LLAVHAIVKNNTSPSLLQNVNFDATPSLKSEIEFLDAYDLSRYVLVVLPSALAMHSRNMYVSRVY